MKCPFRTDEHGEYKDCYGAQCMAYTESGYWKVNDAGDPTLEPRDMCKLFHAILPPFYTVNPCYTNTYPSITTCYNGETCHI